MNQCVCLEQPGKRESQPDEENIWKNIVYLFFKSSAEGKIIKLNKIIKLGIDPPQIIQMPK